MWINKNTYYGIIASLSASVFESTVTLVGVWSSTQKVNLIMLSNVSSLIQGSSISLGYQTECISEISRVKKSKRIIGGKESDMKATEQQK